LVYNISGRAYNFENIYKFPKFQQLARDIHKNQKFGIIDLESYLDENGNSVIYSGAAVIDGVDNQHVEYGNNQDEILYNLFNHILNNENNKIKENRVKYFYAHNGSNFDFLFILKSLSKYPEFNIKVILKDSSQIIEMKISKEYPRKEGSKLKKKNYNCFKG
jgi:DNA polymerase elongation subunit (family B)